MKKELVELNKEYTYAQMCEIFECEQKTSTNSRKSQLKEWESLCKIERPKKGKYAIEEIYEQPKEIEENRGRKSTYGHLIRRGIEDLYCKKGDDVMIVTRKGNDIMAITQKELNKIFLNYDPTIVSEIAETLKHEYVHNKGLNEKAYYSEIRYVKNLIEDKLFCDIWYKQILSKKFKQDGFDNSVGLRLGYQLGNSISWYVSDDAELLNKWSTFQNQYAIDNDIRAYEWNEPSMKYATKEEYKDCVIKFANAPICTEEEAKEIEQYTTPPTTQEIIRGINGEMPNGALVVIQKVFLVEYESGLVLKPIVLEEKDRFELQLQVFLSIKKRFETKQNKRLEDRTFKVKAKMGVKERKIKRINDIRNMFSEELMFKVLDTMKIKK